MRNTIVALSLLVCACSESLIVPEVERGLPDVGAGKPALGALGSWAYLWSPAVRATLTVRSHLTEGKTEAIPDVVAVAAPEEAALVGVYVSDDTALILDAAGGYSLDQRSATATTHESGRWSIQGSSLLLRGAGDSQSAKRLTLTARAEQLRWREQLFVPTSTERQPLAQDPEENEGEGL